MTPRSFWTIVIKILGLYVVLESITTIWQSLNIIIIYSSISSVIDHNYYGIRVYFSLLVSVLLFFIYILIFYSFLFKTDWVINKLKLDKGFPEEIFGFNIDATTVMKIGIIILGGSLLVNYVPDLIREICYYFERTGVKNEQKYLARNILYIVNDIIRIAVGIFMLLRSDTLINFIERKRKKPATNISEETI
jgi:hypothetical protein